MAVSYTHLDVYKSQTNDSPLANPADRPLPSDYTYARIGVPAEVMVALANELQADPWFTLPHLATDDFAHSYAQIVHDLSLIHI